MLRVPLRAGGTERKEVIRMAKKKLRLRLHG